MKLFVGGLSPRVTEDRLQERFSLFGRVNSVKIIRDAYTGISRGFGFVEMPVEAEARTAIDALDGIELYGVFLAVIAARIIS
jgi:RNA recognition motif-containing protein